jgi:hypothetical protein
MVDNDSLAVVVGDIEYDLDDLVMFEVGESVRSLANMFGSRKLKIGSLEIDIPVEDPNVSFEDRLHCIFVFAEYCIWETPNAVFHDIVEKILKLDGWHIGKYSIRTPLWMFDHREIPISEACKLNGLEWIG